MTHEEPRASHLFGLALLLVAAIGFVIALASAASRSRTAHAPRLPAALLDDADAIAARDLAALREAGFAGVVIDLSPLAIPARITNDGAADSSAVTALRAAVASAQAAGLAIDYWIEVGRDPAAAAINAAWLHRPHKTVFYGGEAVVVAEWVCINNKEVFDYELEKVARILAAAPRAAGRRVFLNDVLGAPEGCGCGNALCRLWDGSIGEKIALGEGPGAFGGDPVAPILFAEAIEERFPGLAAVPVITEECEAGVTHAGVADAETTLGYGRMLCTHPDALESYPRLVHLLATRPAIGLLALDRTFGRDDPAFGDPGAWVGAVLDRYRDVDAKQKVWIVVEGWDLGMASVRDRLRAAEAHGAAGAIVARKRIDQSWTVVPAADIGTAL